VEVQFNELYAACRLIATGDQQRGRQALTALLSAASHRGPRWMLALIHALLADLHGVIGDLLAGIEYFRRAVDLGWNDCVAIWSDPGFIRLSRVPGFADVYSQVHVSPADLEELHWLHAEAAVVVREMTRITAENVGRRDGGITDIPQCPLPTRTPDGAGVLGARATLAVIQHFERESIAAEDLRRKGARAAIDLIDGPTDTFAQRWNDERLAESGAAARRASVQARSFRPSPGLSGVPFPATQFRQS